MQVATVSNRLNRDSIALARREAAQAQSPSFAHALGQARASYTVQRGDTLWDICGEALARQGAGTSNSDIHQAVQAVAAANGMANPDHLSIGQRVDLSSLNAPSSETVTAVQMMASIPAQRPEPTPLLLETTPPALATVSTTQSRHSHRPVNVDRLLGSLRSSAEQLTRIRSPWRRILHGSARLSSEFGARPDPFSGKPAHHDGIDLAVKSDTEVSAFRSGRVIRSGWEQGYGNVVIVRHSGGLETVYGHANETLVKEGDYVRAGQTIALSGSSGRSTGPHLHFEVRRNGRPVDPIPYIAPRRG